MSDCYHKNKRILFSGEDSIDTQNENDVWYCKLKTTLVIVLLLLTS